jgi:hypothetical protein
VGSTKLYEVVAILKHNKILTQRSSLLISGRGIENDAGELGEPQCDCIAMGTLKSTLTPWSTMPCIVSCMYVGAKVDM